MKCERCGGKKTICNYEHPEGSEYCLKCKTCPDCHGTGTKPEPEHDERIDNYKEVLKLVNWFTAHLMSQYAKVDAVNKEHIDKLYLEFNKRWKDIITSRNAEIEELGFTNHLLGETISSLEKEIEALKYQLEGFKSQYNEDEKMISALKAEIAKNKRKAEKWDNLAQEMKCSDGGQYYNDMISAITAKINAEVIPLKAEIESMRCCGNCDNLRATPQDHDFCWNNNGNLPSERICKYWTRKTK